MKLFTLLLMLFPWLPPPIETIVDGDILYAIHSPTVVSATRFDDGVIQSSLAIDGPTDPPQGQAPVPVLTTTWTSADGVTHSVSTPVASTTPAGLANAEEIHHTLVTLRQRRDPPRPVRP